MKKREIDDFVLDIQNSINAIESFVKDITIEIIGEATKNIPKSFRSKYPEIPWDEMGVCVISSFTIISAWIWKSYG